VVSLQGGSDSVHALIGPRWPFRGGAQVLWLDGFGNVVVPMPASRQRSRSPSMAWAVMAMMGMPSAGADQDGGQHLGDS